MKIFSAAQIRACDAYTIHASSISSLDLMERAALACAEQLMNRYSRDQLFVMLCGMGNNGGDGLALARILHHNGYGVKALVVKYGDEFSTDCFANLQRLQQIDPGLVSLMEPGSFITDMPPHIIIIDAIFGTGLNRPPEDWLAALFRQINELPNRKIAIDMPSGLSADSIPDDDIVAIRADHTFSFQFYKRAFLHPESGVFAGQVTLLDIGLDATFIASTHTHYYTIDREHIAGLLRRREPFSHKGTYGTALIIGGSHGMMGAPLLAARAAARVGAGKVLTRVPGCGYQIMQSGLPEALCTVSGDRFINAMTGVESDAAGIGPGLGGEEMTVHAFTTFLDQCKQPLVLDADALNILALHPELLGKIPAGSILTPHPKEFERLFGKTVNSMMQVEQARFQSMRYNCHIVLKGRYTAVATPEGACWYNLTGNPGMATGGSGDVLTGMITGLLAQGYTPEAAALTGVYLHGLAGDLALTTQSAESLLAGDIIDYIGAAFRMTYAAGSENS
jgi:hydroxyethylthiazole kinase-like uncharacterized protein yjeF